MSEQEKIDLISEVLELDVDEINKEDKITKYDSWDSLAVMCFIALMDKRYGKLIRAEEMKNINSIQDIMNLM